MKKKRKLKRAGLIYTLLLDVPLTTSLHFTSLPSARLDVIIMARQSSPPLQQWFGWRTNEARIVHTKIAALLCCALDAYFPGSFVDLPLFSFLPSPPFPYWCTSKRIILLTDRQNCVRGVTWWTLQQSRLTRSNERQQLLPICNARKQNHWVISPCGVEQ